MTCRLRSGSLNNERVTATMRPLLERLRLALNACDKLCAAIATAAETTKLIDEAREDM